MFAGLIFVLLFCFGGAAALREGPLAWLFAAVGAISFAVAAGIAIFAIWRRPELLRSERHSLISRYIDLLDDGDMDQSSRDAVGRMIDSFSEEPVPKSALFGRTKTSGSKEGQ
jgi:hypothetical protein